MSETLLEKDSWGIVEVLGHNVFAGKISEHVIGGSAFIRVDVPELTEKTEHLYGTAYIYPPIPAFTKLIGAGSIYAITPCTEDVARKVVDQKRVVPLTILDLSPTTRRLTANELQASPDDALADAEFYDPGVN